MDPRTSCANPRAGWTLIEVKAFGLNSSELHSRLGLAEGMTWPGVLGPRRSASSRPAGGEFAPGQQVAALAAGMGRVFDDGYAELTSVPVNRPISSGGSSKCGSVCSASIASDAVVPPQ